MSDAHRFDTLVARAGIAAAWPNQVATSPPIQASTTWLAGSQREIDTVLGEAEAGFAYGRNGNPTTSLLESALSAIEGGPVVAFSSGMAALHAAVLALDLRAGDAFGLARDGYGTSRTLVADLLGTAGIVPVLLDPYDPDSIEVTLTNTPRLRAVLVEAISNPLIRLPDLVRLRTLTHGLSIRLLIDATLAPPPMFRGLDLGADLVVHSATKYLAGHGDVTAGVVATSPEFEPAVRKIARVAGAIPSPFDSWLTLRGLRTLTLRIERQSRNAAKVADWLALHPAIGRVWYPGRDDHPDRSIARSLLPAGLAGGMLSFEVAAGDQPRVEQFLDSLRLCLPATTLGDLFSEYSYPVVSSHRGLSPEERRRVGISDRLVRLSVGIEDPVDIIADLAQALEAISDR